ncbi:synaptic vesicular amine transporter-like [Diorhabda carinulata]|uniref:synaptic vesicular amine transporter-like n=1 Tax=Diorhabda carinulata TaxID=1163345 RepID=UPI0025A2FEC1|nr:synaptic vesicular amine transporter-like [Diorhabda carinulata]
MKISILPLVEDDSIVFVIIYLLFLLDNVLLTVVVPIIPDFLFSNELNVTIDANDLAPASLSPLQRKFHNLENENGPLGVLLASKALVQLAFTPFIGYLVGVLGCYIPLLVGTFNLLLASILFACGSTYGVLVLARALHGSASAAIAVSGMSILAKKFPPTLRVKLMPIAFGGIASGVLIGYPLGGAVYQMLGKSAPFIFISISIVICIILQLRYLKEESSQCENHSSPNGFQDCIDLLKDHKTIIVVSTICVSTSTMAILEPCVPMWLMARLDPLPTKWQLGAVFIPDSVGYFIGSHFAGFLPVAPWRTAIIAMVIIGLSCYVLPLANTISQLSLPHFGIGLGVGAVDAALVPLLATFADKRGGNHYGPIYALQQSSVSVSYSFGPLLGGLAVRLLGFCWVIRIVGFLNLLISPSLLELEEKPVSDPIP